MNFERYDSISEYRKVTKEFLGEKEAINNLPIGIINRLSDDKGFFKYKETPFLGLVRNENDEIVLTTLITPPYNIIVNGEYSSDMEKAIGEAISYLLENEIDVPGVIGAIDIAKRFAESWAEKTNCQLDIKMNQRIYRLDKVNDVPKPNGDMRLASLDEVELLGKWLLDFYKDIDENADEEGARRSAQHLIEKSKLYVWEVDGKIVSMVGSSRGTENGIVISHVYTPNEYRGKGYATACVAARSQLLLDEGYEFCSLYTDLSNPTSNSIYMKIGYNPIKDSIMYSFK